MGHYYKQDGSSCHRVVGKNGKERDTTIADARKLGLVPSVSTVKELGVGYGLLDWMHNLLLDAAVNNPFHPDEISVEEWKKNIFAQYRAIKEQPQKRGTEIHNKLEDYYRTGTICSKDEAYIVPVIEAMEKQFPGVKWTPEKSFANFEVGFGGCVDMHSDALVLDFKTKDKTELSKTMQYDDHKIQLAAYQKGLELPEHTERWNLFISTHKETPGKCLFIQAKEFDKYIDIFYTMVKLWQQRNNYIPGGSDE